MTRYVSWQPRQLLRPELRLASQFVAVNCGGTVEELVYVYLEMMPVAWP